ncbi:MAG: glycerophosphodiester phosphodiesterase [Candidatus Dormibacteria bacterium]
MARAFLAVPVPFGIAHRGGAEEHPENTMPAFEAAVRLGYRHLETDAHVSADGVVYAFHDSILDRVSDATGPLEQATSKVIDRADAAFHFSPDGRSHPLRGTGIRIPTMEELLTTWPHVFVNIDTKTDAVVAPLLALLRRLDAFDRVCIGSFSDARLARVRELAGGAVCTSAGPRAITAAWVGSRAGRMPRLRADCLQVPTRMRVRIVDRRFVQAAHRAGMQVHVWTIDDEAEMRSLLDLGVDALMTDRPTVLREVLRSRGAWPPAPAAAATA